MIGTNSDFLQMDDPFLRIIPGNSLMNTNYPDSSSGRMIRLFAHIYTQMNSDELSFFAQVRSRRMIRL